MAENQTNFHLLPKILNGGIAGVIGISCTFPLDLVKTRLQKQTAGSDGSRTYNSIFDAFKKVNKAEGFRGMYRGSGVLILLVTPEKAVKLSANDYFRFHLKNKKTHELSPFRQALAGCLTGVVQLVITVPMELLKIQLQDAGRVAQTNKKIDTKTGKLALPIMSARKVALDIYRHRGVVGFYKGTTVTMVRDVPFCALYFPLFAKLDSYGPRKPDGSGDAMFYWSFLSGLVAGSFSALSVTPIDVMKTRIQTIKSSKGEKSYSSVVSAFMDIYTHEGPKAFFKGGACRMIVIAPLYAIIQGIYFMGVAEKILGIEKNRKTI